MLYFCAPDAMGIAVVNLVCCVFYSTTFYEKSLFYHENENELTTTGRKLSCLGYSEITMRIRRMLMGEPEHSNFA